MRKRRKQNKRVRDERIRKDLRERMRITKVMNGLCSDLSVLDIHFITGLTQKNIRKIMLENSTEITFLLLKREHKNEMDNR